jgi:hypothetical protein
MGIYGVHIDDVDTTHPAINPRFAVRWRSSVRMLVRCRGLALASTGTSARLVIASHGWRTLASFSQVRGY